jgi:hypothetical protein
MVRPERSSMSSCYPSTFLAVLFFAAVIGVAPWSIAEDSASKPAGSRLPTVTRAQLRYDGRNFEEWQKEFLTELNPEKRVAALPESTSKLAQPVPQRDVLNLLAMYGPRAASAVGILIRLLKSPEPWKRCAASDVLGAIGAQATLAKVVLQEMALDETHVQDYFVVGWPAVSLDAGRRPAALYTVHHLDSSADFNSPLPPVGVNGAEASADPNELEGGYPSEPRPVGFPHSETIGVHARAALLRIENAAQ